MTVESPTLRLTEAATSEPPIETRVSLEYLCQLREQLEKTTNRGIPCVVLELGSLSPLGPRIQNYIKGNVEYESIGTVRVGVSKRPRSGEYATETSLYLQTAEEHLHEIAALHNEVRAKAGEGGPYKWTTAVPESRATGFIQRVSELEEQVVNHKLP